MSIEGKGGQGMGINEAEKKAIRINSDAECKIS
jgi:hypothetical protein